MFFRVIRLQDESGDKIGKEDVMKVKIRIVIAASLLIGIWIPAALAESGASYTYAAEIRGKICGYATTSIQKDEVDGKPVVTLTDDVKIKVSLLGATVDTEIRTTCKTDPDYKAFTYQQIDIDQGTFKMGASTVIENGKARVTMKPEGTTKVVELPPDVILENGIFFPHLVRDFMTNKMDAANYNVFDSLDAQIQKTRYTKRGEESIPLLGRSFEALVLDEVNLVTGAKATWWLDRSTGQMLKVEFPGRVIYLADPSIRDTITTIPIDDDIFAKVDIPISNFKSITYVKVKATLEPIGAWITPESLNITGQIFTGTVKDNLIEGIFEIEHRKYNGENAPPFPPSFKGEKDLLPYLEPEDFIESADPVLIARAEEITKGAKDAWEAAIRLSEWVANEISYDIPGGGGARNTYDLRVGECGAHSRLFAAFCRAVGIPARVVWGCMLVPNRGGSFGQHGWNEIYMGQGRWIPIDTTAKEIDYADSGHLRIATLQSKSTRFNPKSMEILDWRAGDLKKGDELKSDNLEKYQRFLGKYKGPADKVFTVKVQNNHLAVDIPGQMAFELAEPDAEGKRAFLLTDQVKVVFKETSVGKVTTLVLYQDVRLPKKENPESIEADVPESFQPYLGSYPVPMAQMELTVVYKNGNLAIHDPQKGIVHLKDTGDRGVWIDEFDQNRISFATREDGKVLALVIHQMYDFHRITEEEAAAQEPAGAKKP